MTDTSQRASGATQTGQTQILDAAAGESPSHETQTRRAFFGHSLAASIAATTAAGLASPTVAALAGARGWATSRSGRAGLRVGVIGCGGRGTGAAVNALQAHPGTTIVAMADLFPDRLQGSRNHLQGIEEFKDRVRVAEDRLYVGFDAYQRLLDDGGVDYVVLATPPHFRPIHFAAAVTAGVHVFMEKPVAVDPVGVRRVIEAAASADAQSLCVVTGTQRRHEASYLAAMEQIAGGAIGDVVSARCYWNQGGLWVHQRRDGETDMEYQCRNWLYFAWLSGDHICEQHIHNLDVVNWAMGGPPVKAMGMGGRQVRTGAEYGNIFDHFAIEYEYTGGRHALSMCRQIDGCQSRVEEAITGSKGVMRTRPGFAQVEGPGGWRFDQPNENPYVQEHRNLIAAIESGSGLNEARRTAESTLTAIMGRMSAYTGKEVTWEQAMNSQLDLAPARYEFGDLEMRPVPTPGRTPLI
ncbi:MAG: Gfo/Idh/MocA family protein [Phycisphaerales bacterium JB037]